MREIRLAGACDLDAVATLNREVQALHAQHRPALFPAPDDAAAREGFTEALGSPEWRIWLACVGGAPVGYAMTELLRREATAWRLAEVEGRIHQISVAENARRRGHGAALIAHARADLRARGAGRATASYWAFNVASAGLFAKAGFSAEHHLVAWTP